MNVFVEKFDNGGTMVPPRDSGPNCSMNIAEPEGGSERPKSRELSGSLGGKGTHSGYRDTEVSRQKVQPLSMLSGKLYVISTERPFLFLCFNRKGFFYYF